MSKWRWNRLLLKRKKFFFIRIIANIYIYTSLSLDYKKSNDFFSFDTILSIFSPKRQMYFNFFNVSLTFNHLFSSGVFLKNNYRCFKFFKKSQISFNPLLLMFKYKYFDDLDFLFCLSIRNFLKKHYIFLKKFFLYIRTEVKYLLLTKSWNFTTKPKKRIKKKTIKQVASFY